METTKKKGGRPSEAQTKRNFATYCESRAKGHNKQESGNLAGVNRKTADKYERLRLQAQADKRQRLINLRQRLENKADSPEITAKELIGLTLYIKQLDQEISEIV